jgi:hypothetical protein
VNPQYLTLGAILTDPATSVPAKKAGITVPYAGFTGSVAQALRPFPQYLTLTSQAAKDGASIYNGLEVSVTKRFGSGFTLGGNYSWAKALGYGESGLYGGGSTNNILQNSFDPHPEWSLLPIDVRNSFLLHYIYDLPFGRGKPWLNQRRISDVIFGGWRVSAIQKYQSGFPLEICQSNTLPIFNSVLRPSIVQGVAVSNHIPVKQFRPSTSRMLAASTDLASNSFSTMNQIVEDSFGSQNLAAGLLEIFSCSALLLCLIGIYGLLVYLVAQREHEVGLRIALLPAWSTTRWPRSSRRAHSSTMAAGVTTNMFRCAARWLIHRLLHLR